MLMTVHATITPKGKEGSYQFLIYPQTLFKQNISFISRSPANFPWNESPLNEFLEKLYNLMKIIVEKV